MKHKLSCTYRSKLAQMCVMTLPVRWIFCMVCPLLFGETFQIKIAIHPLVLAPSSRLHSSNTFVLADSFASDWHHAKEDHEGCEEQAPGLASSKERKSPHLYEVQCSHEEMQACPVCPASRCADQVSKGKGSLRCVSSRPHLYASSGFVPLFAEKWHSPRLERPDLSPLWRWESPTSALLQRQKGLGAQVHSQALQKICSATWLPSHFPSWTWGQLHSLGASSSCSMLCACGRTSNLSSRHLGHESQARLAHLQQPWDCSQPSCPPETEGNPLRSQTQMVWCWGGWSWYRQGSWLTAQKGQVGAVGWHCRAGPA